MAIEQVTALINGQTYTLIYDPAFRAYKAAVTLEESSASQPEGYYNAEITAVNDAGVSVSTDGGNLPGLRLVVKDLTPPALTLVSPPEGYLNTASPSVVADVTDQHSGVDISTLTVTADGTEVSASTEPIERGFRVTATPVLVDGLHTLTFSVADLDGNTGKLTVRSQVDTAPPVLTVHNHRTVVDVSAQVLRGQALDAAAPVMVTITRGTYSETAEAEADGSYAFTAPLNVGENTFTLTATDAAGNASTQSVWVMRLITGRTKSDLDRLKSLLKKPVNTWTEEELEMVWTGMARGSYDFSDLNRVGMAAEYLSEELRRYGYYAPVISKTDYQRTDAPQKPEMERYLRNVYNINNAAPTQQLLPSSMKNLGLNEANQIEAALVAVDAVFPRLRTTYLYSGEAFSGEF